MAKQMAMPPPIVPAPTMPALAIVRAFVSAGMSEILRVARSAKKTWIAPLLSGVALDWLPSFSSNERALGERLFHRGLDRPTAVCAAMRLGYCFFAVASAAAKISGGRFPASPSSLVRRGPCHGGDGLLRIRSRRH